MEEIQRHLMIFLWVGGVWGQEAKPTTLILENGGIDFRLSSWGTGGGLCEVAVLYQLFF